MPRKNTDTPAGPTGPAAISVTAMADLLGLNRSYFWTLCKRQVFPMPLYDLATKRPFFDAELQGQCQEVRRSHIGWNGQYVLFYDRAGVSSPAPRARRAPREPRDRIMTPVLAELAASLREDLGVEATDIEIVTAAKAVYPDGLAECDGEAVRRVFSRLRRKN